MSSVGTGSTKTLKRRLNRLRLRVILYDAQPERPRLELIEDIRAMYNYVVRVKQGLEEVSRQPDKGQLIADRLLKELDHDTPL